MGTRRFVAFTSIAAVAAALLQTPASAQQTNSNSTDINGGVAVQQAVLAMAAEASPQPLRVVATVTGTDGRPEFVTFAADTSQQLRDGVAVARTTGTVESLALDQVIGLVAPVATETQAGVSVNVANDPFRPVQWALDQTDFEAQWSRADGGGVTVAVLDTGVLATHLDAPVHLETGRWFLSGGEGAGAPGVQFHGTHVAGIIAAAANNYFGVAGAAPGATILPVKVLGDNGSGWTSDVAKGVVWATDNGADIINMSLGSAAPDDALHAAIEYAYSRGVVVFAAAGNNGCDVNGGFEATCPANWPAAEPHAIAVGAVGEYQNGTWNANLCATFSTRASYVALSAPGSGIYSLGTVNGNTTITSASGTSMATPYAAAAAALLLSYNNTLTPDQVKAALTGTATDAHTAGYDTCTGAGRINPGAALNSVTPGNPTTTTAPTTTTTAPTTTTSPAPGNFTATVTRTGNTVTITGSTPPSESVRCVQGRCQARWVSVTRTVNGRPVLIGRVRVSGDGTYSLGGLTTGGVGTVTMSGLGSRPVAFA